MPAVDEGFGQGGLSTIYMLCGVLKEVRGQLVTVNNPDKILFVGEALVGNEAVDQLTKFDRALRDFSSSTSGRSRGIDGMLVTKWDTVDDKVRVVSFVLMGGDHTYGRRGHRSALRCP